MFKRFLIFLLIAVTLMVTSCSSMENSNISVWIIGDSMAAKSNAHAGWGEVLQYYITSDVTVRNTAMGGASASSFPEEVIYDMIFENAVEGDYAVIMLGHNDALHETRNTNPYADSDSEGSFKNLLKYKFIVPLIDIGVTPVLTTCVTVPVYENGKTSEMLYSSHANAIRELYEECKAEGLGVEMIDTCEITRAYYDEIGEDDAMEYHIQDGYYHYSLKGAVYAAGVVAEGLKELDVPGFETILSENEAYELANE